MKRLRLTIEFSVDDEQWEAGGGGDPLTYLRDDIIPDLRRSLGLGVDGSGIYIDAVEVAQS